MTFDIRYSEFSDEEDLENWLNSPEMNLYFPYLPGKEVEMAARHMIGFSRFKASLTAHIDGKPIGMATLFLMPYKKIVHHAQVQIVIDPAHRGKGVSKSLLKNVKNLAQNYFNLELIYFDVVEKSPFISLLRKQGFTEYGKQKEFYFFDEKMVGRKMYECLLKPMGKEVRVAKPAVRSKEKREKKDLPLTFHATEDQDADTLTQWFMRPGILRWYPMVNTQEILDSVRYWMHCAKKGACLTAKSDGKIVAMACLYIQENERLSKQCLLTIIVDEKMRSYGIGEKMMVELEKLAKEKFGIRVLQLEVYVGNYAIFLYEKMGFTRFGEQRYFIKEEDGEYIPKIMMEKLL